MASASSRSRWTPLSLVLLAVFLLALVGGLLLRTSQQPRGEAATKTTSPVLPGGAVDPVATATRSPSPTFFNRPDPDGRVKASHEEIFGRLRNLDDLRNDDVGTIEAFVGQTETPEALISARNALVVGADRLVKASMDPAVRTRLEGVVLGSLSNGNWRVRLSGLSAVREAGLLDRPGVPARVVAMRSDPEEKVALRAKNTVLPGEPTATPAPTKKP